MTLLGAVANVIVAEKSRDICQISFKDFLYYGLPSTILLFLIGFLVIYLYFVFIPLF
jgi:Na+/H+ antiporter NhaD/arsenite permease-like protein